MKIRLIKALGITFVITILLPLNSFSLPNRVKISKGLEAAFRKAKLTDNSYLDKFTVKSDSLSKTLKVTYGSEDPVIAVGLSGGKIKSFVRDQSGSVVISFVYKPERGGDAVQLRLVTTSSLSLPTNSPGFDQAITGSFFSSSSALLSDTLKFYDEPVVPGSGNSISWGNNYIGKSKKKVTVTLHAFIPFSAITYFNGGTSLSAEELIVRTYTGEGYVEAANVKIVVQGDGLLVTVPVKLSTRLKFVDVDIAKRQ